MQLHLIGRKHIRHRIALQIIIRAVGAGTFAHRATAAPHRQRIAVVDIVNVVAQEQRTGVFRHVRQRFAFVIRIVGDLRIGIAVAGDNAQVIGQRPGHVHFDAAGAHFTGGFCHRLIAHGFRVEDVALINIKQRDIGGDAIEQIELRAQLVRRRLFRRQIANIAGDRGLRHKRLRHVTEQRDGRRQLIHQARFRRPFLVAAVGIDVKRAALAGVLGVILIAHPGDGNPLIGKIERVLEVARVALLLNTLVAVGCRNAGAFANSAVDRIIDIETLDVLTADHIGAQQIVILVGQAGEDLVVETANDHVAL